MLYLCARNLHTIETMIINYCYVNSNMAHRHCEERSNPEARTLDCFVPRNDVNSRCLMQLSTSRNNDIIISLLTQEIHRHRIKSLKMF
jgi:hypothetical protein